MPVKKLPGGSVKIVDSTLFKISKDIAVAEVTVEPGAMRELHVSIMCSWMSTLWLLLTCAF
jgi:oxalate decarboxylase/phosphoglucose isomerase-like protein (cupin superfamily)